jgi:hypothetical protein
VHAASPAVQVLRLSGGAAGQPALVPPLLLPLLLAVPLLLPLLLAVPLLLPLLLVVPLLLPLLLAVPLLLPLLPPLLLALASSPVPEPALVLPPHAGARMAKPPMDRETRTRTLIALIEEPPAVRTLLGSLPTWRSRSRLGSVTRRSEGGTRQVHPLALSPIADDALQRDWDVIWKKRTGPRARLTLRLDWIRSSDSSRQTGSLSARAPP